MDKIAKLQNEATTNVRYKVIVFGRHGQGWRE
jgi:hypothetical protein